MYHASGWFSTKEGYIVNTVYTYIYLYIYVYIDTVLSEHCIHQTSTSSCHFVVGNSPPVSESFWMSRVASLACFRSILEHLPKFELRELYNHLIILLHWLFLFRRKHGLQKLDLGLKGSMATQQDDLLHQHLPSRHLRVLESCLLKF